jgi:hypothetical protein
MEPQRRELAPGLAAAAAGTGVVLVVFGATAIEWQLGLIAFGACLLLVALLGVET